MPYNYPALLDILAFHHTAIERYGGSHGVRDEGALESALVRPQMAAHYADADLATQAALLISGIALAHAFVDGNKRAALMGGVVFLYINGFVLDTTQEEIVAQIMGLLTRVTSSEEATAAFAEWIRVRLQVR